MTLLEPPRAGTEPPPSAPPAEGQERASALLREGLRLRREGRLGEAIAMLRQAVLRRPDLVEALVGLGAALFESGRGEEAVTLYRRAIALRAGAAPAHQNLGVILESLGRLDEAAASYDAALSLRRDDAIVLNRALMLPAICDSAEHLAAARQRFAHALARLEAMPLSIDNHNALPSGHCFYLAYHGESNRDLISRYAGLLRRAAPALRYAAPHIGKPRRAGDGRVRIGFYSHFLGEHTIGHLFGGLVAGLSQQRFEKFLFTTRPGADRVSGRIASECAHRVALGGQLESDRETIAACGLDIMFYPDIGMHPLSLKLAFARLAPLQCMSWGHPETTGIDTMDAFLSHADCESAEGQSHYSEKLLELSGNAAVTRYRPPAPRARRGREQFGLPSAVAVYVAPHSLFKFHPAFDSVLAEILRGDETGILVLIEGAQPFMTERLKRRFGRAMPDVAGRIRFLPRLSQADYDDLVAVADVYLDSHPFGSGKSALDCLAAGTPIVALPSAFTSGRFVRAAYRRMGMADALAATPADYVAKALALGRDPELRRHLRRRILAANNVLYDDMNAVRETENLLLQAWRERVEQYR